MCAASWSIVLQNKLTLDSTIRHVHNNLMGRLLISISQVYEPIQWLYHSGQLRQWRHGTWTHKYTFITFVNYKELDEIWVDLEWVPRLQQNPPFKEKLVPNILFNQVQPDPKHWAENACSFVANCKHKLPTCWHSTWSSCSRFDKLWEQKKKEAISPANDCFIFGKKSRQARTDINEHSHAYSRMY